MAEAIAFQIILKFQWSKYIIDLSSFYFVKDEFYSNRFSIDSSSCRNSS